MQLWKASQIASDVLSKVKPYCERALVVGSVRRGDAVVKDIDILVLPKIERVVLQADLWGKPVTWRVHSHLVKWMSTSDEFYSLIEVTKVGDKMVTGFVRGEAIKIEFFILDDPRQWGVACAVRTGPAGVSKRLMEFALLRHYHVTGFLLHGHEKGGRPGKRTVCSNGSDCRFILPTIEEQDFFYALGLACPGPTIRTVERQVDIEREALKVKEARAWQ